MQTRIPQSLDHLAVPLDNLVPYEQNPRRGNTAVIVDSLSRHGQYRPIVVRAKTFQVLAGNHTLAAAKELGWTEIAATFVDVSDDEAARIVLVDNRSADLGDYDDTELLNLLSSLEVDLGGSGYTDLDLENLRALMDADVWGDGDRHHAGAGVDEDPSFHPHIELRVTVPVFEAWLDLLNTQTGATDVDKLAAYLVFHGFLDPEALV